MTSTEHPTSWIIRERATGRVIAETWNAEVIAALNTARYEAVPIREYLASINQGNKAGS